MKGSNRRPGGFASLPLQAAFVSGSSAGPPGAFKAEAHRRIAAPHAGRRPARGPTGHLAARRGGLSAAWLCGGLLLAGGCSGGGVPLFPVEGTVTFEGRPLERGSIVFDSADGLAAPVMGGIEAGRYRIDAPEGEKIVRIDAVRTLERKDQYGSPITESFIPSGYNGESQLRMRVVAGGVNTFDVAMEKRGPGR